MLVRTNEDDILQIPDFLDCDKNHSIQIITSDSIKIENKTLFTNSHLPILIQPNFHCTFLMNNDKILIHQINELFSGYPIDTYLLLREIVKHNNFDKYCLSTYESINNLLCVRYLLRNTKIFLSLSETIVSLCTTSVIHRMLDILNKNLDLSQIHAVKQIINNKDLIELWIEYVFLHRFDRERIKKIFRISSNKHLLLCSKNDSIVSLIQRLLESNISLTNIVKLLYSLLTSIKYSQIFFSVLFYLLDSSDVEKELGILIMKEEKKNKNKNSMLYQEILHLNNIEVKYEEYESIKIPTYKNFKINMRFIKNFSC